MVDINIMDEGDIFGVIAVLDEQPRTASVIAYEDCEIAKITLKNFDNLINENKCLALKFVLQTAKKVASRFRKMDLKVKLALWGNEIFLQ